jgi:hypothetical protein
MTRSWILARDVQPEAARQPEVAAGSPIDQKLHP